MGRTDSPLRYPGGKSQLKGFINDLLKNNNIVDGTYVEPFAGGAGVAISLLYENRVKNIIINDLDKSIYSFWKAILFHTEDFIKKILAKPVTIEQWYKEKDIQTNRDKYSTLDIGFSTFFLNRTNVSGIISGGPIGGHDQNGNYKIDCRFNKDNLIKKIRKIASFKDRIHITNYDAVEFIQNIITQLDRDKTFIFFDPPYYQQGKNLYTNFYNHQDHVDLSNHIKALDDFYWITTYDMSKKIENIYNIDNTKRFIITYSANNKRKAAELLFYSDKVSISEYDRVKFI